MSDTTYFKEDDRTACREIMDEAKDREYATECSYCCLLNSDRAMCLKPNDRVCEHEWSLCLSRHFVDWALDNGYDVSTDDGYNKAADAWIKSGFGKEEKNLLTKEEALSIRTCPWRSKTFSLLNPGSSQAVCKKTDGTIVFSYCLKCDAFKGKDSLDKTWNVDSKPRFDMWASLRPWINCKYAAIISTSNPNKKEVQCCARIDQKQGRFECKKCGLNIDAKDSKSPFLYRDVCPHFHENDLDEWCELDECEQVFERCEKCCACDKNVDETFEKAFQALKQYLNDQTAKADAGKAQLSLVPQKIIYAIARIREYGNAKYPEGGKDNWKSVEKQRYVDAMLRHISAYVSDPEGVDEESGFPHLYHAATNLAFILEMEGEE